MNWASFDGYDQRWIVYESVLIAQDGIGLDQAGFCCMLPMSNALSFNSSLRRAFSFRMAWISSARLECGFSLAARAYSDRLTMIFDVVTPFESAKEWYFYIPSM
jgi:hypothetical protein